MLSLWDTARLAGNSTLAAAPPGGWHQAALLASWSGEPQGSVRGGAAYNVTPADVVTDVRGAARAAAPGGARARPAPRRAAAR